MTRNRRSSGAGVTHVSRAIVDRFGRVLVEGVPTFRGMVRDLGSEFDLPGHHDPSEFPEYGPK
ncbi:MAG TPA: hypothetical protein VFT74_11425 [Isosphaeraceae bacterium]|nr:hypothetical protein [Isosphaeraceae bacterium]